MIIVTGATGQLGAGIVERLLERVAAGQVGVSVRDPAKATALADRGVRVRAGDYADPATLADAFEGASQVLIISSNSLGGEALTHHRAAIEAATAAGAERILYTSHMGASPSSPFAPMPDHAETEQALQACGVAFTSLRNGFYASTVVRFVSQALQSGQLIAPEDGKVSWTDHADLAEIAAMALAGNASLGGLTPPLTGSESLDLADAAELASELSGRMITRVVVSDQDFVDGMVSRGVPAAQASLLRGLFEASRAGEFEAVDPALEQLLGRPPVTLREVLAASIAA